MTVTIIIWVDRMVRWFLLGGDREMWKHIRSGEICVTTYLLWPQYSRLIVFLFSSKNSLLYSALQPTCYSAVPPRRLAKPHYSRTACIKRRIGMWISNWLVWRITDCSLSLQANLGISFALEFKIALLPCSNLNFQDHSVWYFSP